MATQQPSKSPYRSYIVGLLGMGSVLLISPALPAAAQDTVGGVQSRADARRATAEAVKAGLESEAAAFSAGNIRYSDPYPRPLNANEIDVLLDRASQGTIQLWYASNGYAIKGNGDTVTAGDLIPLSNQLLKAALENRRTVLANNAQRPFTNAAPFKATGEAASAMGKGVSDTVDGVVSAVALAGVAYVAAKMMGVDLSDTGGTASASSNQPSQPRTEAPQQQAAYQPQSAAYQDGVRDRTTYENWFAGLSGAVKEGAEWWASVRSEKPQRSCQQWRETMSNDWINGCVWAKSYLDQTDIRRKSEREYKLGWNSIP